jgi:phage-related protein
LSGVPNGLRALCCGLAGGLSTVLGTFAGGLRHMPDSLRALLSGVPNGLRALCCGLAGGLSTVLGTFAGSLRHMPDSLRSLLGGMASGLGTMLGTLANGVRALYDRILCGQALLLEHLGNGLLWFAHWTPPQGRVQVNDANRRWH